VILYVKLVLTALFWGGTFVAGRIVSQHVPPFSAALLRFLVASLFLIGFVLKHHGRIPRLERDQIFPVLMLALTGVFAYNALFFSGLKTITASRASLIIASNPAFIALFAAVFFRDRLSIQKLLGIFLSMLGAITVISHGNPMRVFDGGLGMGELYICGCVASWVCYSLIGKLALQRLSPLVTVTYACGLGAVLLLLPALFEVSERGLALYPVAAWLGIVYLGFFGSALGFIWYYEGIREIGPARAGVFINIVPVSSIVLAFLFLNEALDVSLAAGALMVISGVFLTNRTPQCRPILIGTSQTT
jgi:drug/metabolite transporter (DMT)-like permease